MQINEQYFSKADVENGLMTKFIAELCKHSYESEFTFNEILIKPADVGAFTVEWIQSNWQCRDMYPRFSAIDTDEVVMHEVVLPDNSIIYSSGSKETDEEIIKEWLDENPSFAFEQETIEYTS